MGWCAFTTYGEVEFESESEEETRKWVAKSGKAYSVHYVPRQSASNEEK